MRHYLKDLGRKVKDVLLKLALQWGKVLAPAFERGSAKISSCAQWKSREAETSEESVKDQEIKYFEVVQCP